MPTVVVTTTSFLELTRRVASSSGVPDARIAVVDHPLGGITEAEVGQRAASMVEALVACFTLGRTAAPPRSEHGG